MEQTLERSLGLVLGMRSVVSEEKLLQRAEGGR